LDFTKEKTSINSVSQKELVAGRAHRRAHKSATARKLAPPLALPLPAKSRGEGKNGAARSSPRSLHGCPGNQIDCRAGSLCNLRASWPGSSRPSTRLLRKKHSRLASSARRGCPAQQGRA
jgi:hypothetical protein